VLSVCVLGLAVNLLVFSALYSILDVKRCRWWTPWALILGTNAMLTFALSNVLTTLADRIHINMRNGLAPTILEWGYRYALRRGSNKRCVQVTRKRGRSWESLVKASSTIYPVTVPS
jgi:hypothetical protein